MARQMPDEPLPASVLFGGLVIRFGFVCCVDEQEFRDVGVFTDVGIKICRLALCLWIVIHRGDDSLTVGTIFDSRCGGKSSDAVFAEKCAFLFLALAHVDTGHFTDVERDGEPIALASECTLK